MTVPLILASRSPRRMALLELLELPFTTRDARVDERRIAGESPETMARRLAELKASSVFRQFGPDVRVLAGDTIVSIGNRVLGKPEDREQAVSMLKRLSGETHTVISAVALAQAAGCRSLVSRTRVTFRRIDPEAISLYCDTPDPYDKAGAYGIQGGASGFVERIEGSYTGVVGFPLWHVHQLLFSGPPDQRHA